MPVASIRTESSILDPATQFFQFITLNTPGGAPLVEALHMEEELTAEGVNGRRWRTIFDQFEPFTVETLADTTSYTLAVQLREKYRLSRGTFARLSLTASDYVMAFRIHILDVQARCSPGRTVGTGVTANATAVIMASWTVVRVQE